MAANFGFILQDRGERERESKLCAWLSKGGEEQRTEGCGPVEPAVTRDVKN